MKTFKDWMEELWRRVPEATLGELNRKVGVSKSTGTRMIHGYNPPSRSNLKAYVAFAAKGYPDIARGMAASRGTTVEKLGVTIEAPRSPASPAPASGEAVDAAIIEAVLYAGARRSSAPASEIVPVLRAVFDRMRELGVGLEKMERALERIQSVSR